MKIESIMEVFSIDRPQSEESMAQYATQHIHLDERTIAWCRERWGGDQSDDFYKGLITGLAVVVSMFDSAGMKPPHIETSVRAFLTFVAKQREDLQELDRQTAP